MDETSFAIAVETTTQVEVLRTAFVALAVNVIGRLPTNEQAALLKDIQTSAGTLPLRSGPSTADGQRIYDHVRSRAPSVAQQLVQDVTKALT